MYFNNALLEYLFPVLVLLYSAEAFLFLRGVINKLVKKPVETLKTIFLTTISFIIVFLFFVWNTNFEIVEQIRQLLIFDTLTPIIITTVVLFCQPIFVLIRNNTLKKATNKINKIKSEVPLKVIAITGSYGKTSTKEFLATILSKKYKVLKTKDNQNSEIGIAKCILENLDHSHQIFIAEVGAYNKGKVKEVCSILKPDIGIVTGVNEQHLALFGSLENLLSAEGGGELAHSLSENGILIVNGDNKYCLDLYKEKNVYNKRVYSLTNKVVDANIWTEEIEVAKDYVYFVVMDKNKEMGHFKVNVLGKHNVQNLLGAILVARELGMGFGEISEACKKINTQQGGMVLEQGKHGINIINSSYSSNPDGVIADLDYFRILDGKKVIVMPCLIELGNKSVKIHQKIGKKIGKICDLAIITSKDKFEEIKKGAQEVGMPESKILLCDKPRDIYSLITLTCKFGDSVLLEGRVPSELIKLLNE